VINLAKTWHGRIEEIMEAMLKEMNQIKHELKEVNKQINNLR
jgi:hypothetical protein